MDMTLFNTIYGQCDKGMKAQLRRQANFEKAYK